MGNYINTPYWCICQATLWANFLFLETGSMPTCPPAFGYKFQELDVYKISLDYLDQVYGLASLLPESERFNLKNQLERSATSIVLNIAEGSTVLSDVEQKRFLSVASRSYLETVACLDIMLKRKYVQDHQMQNVREMGHRLFVKLQAFKKALR